MSDELKYVRYSRNMAANESKDVPDAALAKAAETRHEKNIALKQNISSRNVRALTEYSGVCPILIDGINQILTKTAMQMKKCGIARLEDVPCFEYIKSTDTYSVELSIGKWLQVMLGDYSRYAKNFRQQLEILKTTGYKVIWDTTPVYDKNGKLIGEHVTAINAPALQVVFKSDGIILDNQEIQERLKIAEQEHDPQKIKDAKNLANQAKNAANLSKVHNASDTSTYMPNTKVVTLFNRTLFKDIIYPDAKGSHGFFNTTTYLQLKLMDGIECALQSRAFQVYKHGELADARFKLNAIMARQILLFLFQHDNGGEYVYYNIVDLARSVFPSLVDTRRTTIIDGKECKGYVSPADQYTIRGCIEKVCVVYSIMLCRGDLDGNAIIPIYDYGRVRAETDMNRIRLCHSNIKHGFSFSEEQRNDIKQRLIQQIGQDVLTPLLT